MNNVLGALSIRNCIMTISLDLENNEETLMIGEYDDINNYLKNNNQGLKYPIKIYKKSLGYLIYVTYDVAHFELAAFPASLLNYYNEYRKKMENDDVVSYESDPKYIELQEYAEYVINCDENVMHYFVYLKSWSEFNKRLSILAQCRNTKHKNDLDSVFSELFSLDSFLDYKSYINNFYDYFYSEFYNVLDKSIENNRVDSTIISTSSIGEIKLFYNNITNIIIDNELKNPVLYYLNIIFKHNYIFKICPECNLFFIAKNNSKEKFCDDCKLKRKKNSREIFNRENNNDYYLAYEATRVYWCKKRKKHEFSLTKQQIDCYNAKFSDFKNEAKQIIHSNIAIEDYRSWLLSQRDQCDNILNGFIENGGECNNA